MKYESKINSILKESGVSRKDFEIYGEELDYGFLSKSSYECGIFFNKSENVVYFVSMKNEKLIVVQNARQNLKIRDAEMLIRTNMKNINVSLEKSTTKAFQEFRRYF